MKAVTRFHVVTYVVTGRDSAELSFAACAELKHEARGHGVSAP